MIQLLGLLKPIGAFIGGNWKVLGLVVIGTILFFKLEGWISDFANNLQEKQNRIETLRAERDLAVIEKEQAAELEKQREKHRVEMDALRARHQTELAQVRATAKAERAVLEDRERLRRLTNAKPGRLEQLANAATQKRFDELEAIFNSN